MRISLNWLNDYINIKSYSVQQIAEILTHLGFEVENIEEFCPISGDIVVGRILKSEKHPNADTLWYCLVDVADKEPLEIVCGAPNAHLGKTVCVAKVGSVVANGLKIKKTKIRGILSNGMICAEDELGIGSDHTKIVELSDNVPIGSSVIDLFQLRDVVLDINVPPNRPDLLGIVGVAREISAKLGIPLKYPNIDDVKYDSAIKTQDMIQVHIESKDDCPRYVALYIEDVNPQLKSPIWMQKRLESCGIRPINLIVDITNYVMLEYAQPVHAFDYELINNKEIYVKRAFGGERFITLDSKERVLSVGDLLICDKKGPIALAGIIGGANSEINSNTKAIVIEVASFNSSMIRKTSKNYSIRTEASYRFERGTDIKNLLTVTKRVAFLLQDLTVKIHKDLGLNLRIPKIASTVIDNYDLQGVSLPKVALRFSRLEQILGIHHINKTTVLQVLQNLGFNILDSIENRILVEVPSWRLDIEKEIDLIEEVARFIGLQNVPTHTPVMDIKVSRENPFINFIEKCRLSFAYQGFCEVMNLPFISFKDLENFNVNNTNIFYNTLQLENPLVEDENVLSPLLSILLLKALKINKDRGDNGAKLFECARVYANYPEYSSNYDMLKQNPWPFNSKAYHLVGKALLDKRPVERHMIAGIIDQPLMLKSWDNSEVIKASFYDGKKVCVSFLNQFNIKDLQFKYIDTSFYSFLNASASALIYYKDIVLGYVGEIHPKVLQNYDMDFRDAPIVFEICLENVFDIKNSSTICINDISKFPSIQRDIAFVLDDKITYETVHNFFSDLLYKGNLISFRLFDLYRGSNISAGQKSLAISLIFQSRHKTLTDVEIDAQVNKITKLLVQKLNATLRI